MRIVWCKKITDVTLPLILYTHTMEEVKYRTRKKKRMRVQNHGKAQRPTKRKPFCLAIRQYMTWADVNTKHYKVNCLICWMAFYCSLLIFNSKYTQKDLFCTIVRKSRKEVSAQSVVMFHLLAQHQAFRLFRIFLDFLTHAHTSL